MESHIRSITYLILFSLPICWSLEWDFAPQSNVHTMLPGSNISCCEYHLELPEIYCYRGREKQLSRIWETVLLHVSLSNDQFQQFDGSHPEQVMAEFDQHRSSWNSFSFHFWKKKNIRINPFNATCIGISTKHNYFVNLQVIRVDYWKILLMISGLGLFLSAPKLSNNSLFYYLTGISFGVCASFLIIVFVVSRLLPKKPLMYSFLVGGWTVGVYLAQLLWDNFRVVVVEHKSTVVAYCGLTGIISFVICYRFGPVTDPRSKNLIKWAMQVGALVVIFCSSEYQEASVAVIILLLVIYNLPKGLLGKVVYKLKKFFYKPKPQLLTEDEYYHQGVIETEKALRELRGFCSSPECNQWKTVLRLKHPLRFAKFMEGASHLEDEEVLAFETDIKSSISDQLLTDDDEDSDDSSD